MTEILETPKLVVVFGGSGFIGRHVVRALAMRGYRIRVGCRRPDLAGHLQPLGNVGQIQPVQANVRVRWSIDRAVEGADHVVNLVGILHESGRQRFNTVHQFGAQAIAEAARAAGAGLTHVSALGADVQSASAYARTKALGERAVLATIPDAVILRPSIAFGPEDGFFNRFAAMARFSPALPLIGGGKTRFQPVYAGDVGAAVASALDDVAARGKTFELGGPGVYDFKTILEMILKETGHRRFLAPLPFPVAAAIGAAGDLVAMTPFPPPLTSDQVLLLKSDNVVSPGALGLGDLGVTPTAVEGVISTYLWRFRKGGQFAQPEAANA